MARGPGVTRLTAVPRPGHDLYRRTSGNVSRQEDIWRAEGHRHRPRGTPPTRIGAKAVTGHISEHSI
jgi:hypothetical protein